MVGWPTAVHHEFTVLRDQPVVYVRLDNELSPGDARSQKLSEAMQGFVGKKISLTREAVERVLRGVLA